MKKYFIVLFVCVLSLLKSEAQVYVPFPDSNAIWRVYTREIGCTCCASYDYTLEGDTVINSVSYRIVHQDGLIYFEDGMGACTSMLYGSINDYVGAIRSDNILKKVFILPRDSLTEYLLYDFNMIVGDTVQGWLNYSSFLGWFPTVLVVGSIDSILIVNQYRKRFNFMVPGAPGTPIPQFIEGIGSTFDPFTGPLYEFEWGIRLTCFRQNGQVIYPDTNSSCILTEVAEKQNLSSEVSIFPNPFLSEITISIQRQNVKYLTFSIKNIFGQVVLEDQESFAVSDNASIDLSSLSQGIYYLDMVLDDKRVVRMILKASID